MAELHEHTIRSRRAASRWRLEHAQCPVVLTRGKKRLVIAHLDVSRVKDGRECVEVICALEEKHGRTWRAVPADPHGHYRFVGPPEQLEDELWHTVLAVAGEDFQGPIREAQQRGEFVASTDVYYPDTSGGYITSQNTLYETARSGGGSFNLRPTSLPSRTFDIVGQDSQSTGPSYDIYEDFLAIQTGGLPDTATITAAGFYAYGSGFSGGSNFTVEMYLDSWSTPLVAGDWVPGANIAGLGAKLAGYYTGGGWATSGYNAFTSTAAMASAINKTGATNVVLVSDRTRLDDADYLDDRWVAFYNVNAAAGNWPKLIVTYATGQGSPSGGAGSAVNYAKKCWWPTAQVAGAGSSPWQYRYACEEGIAPEDRAFYQAGVAPAASAYWDYSLPIPQGGLQIPSGTFVVKVAYSMPQSDDQLCSLDVSITADAGAWTSSVTNWPLTHTSGQPALVGIPITVSGTPPAIARLATSNCYVHVAIHGTPTTSGTTLYPVPIDDTGLVADGHVGLQTSQPTVTALARNAPVVVLESPHAGSHTAPTRVAGMPVIKLTSDGLYPTDTATVSMYADSLQTATHEPINARLQIQAVPISAFTVGVMLRDTTRRYVEIGNSPYFVSPPDKAADQAFGAWKWYAGQTYVAGTILVPTYPWANYYWTNLGGIAGTTEPVWPTSGGTVTDGTVIWQDMGPRYIYVSNTYYEIVLKDGMGNTLLTIPLESILDVTQKNTVSAVIEPPRLIPQPDCTTKDEITLKVQRGAATTDQNPFAVVFELTYPDGTVRSWDAGYQSEKNIGKLTAS